METLCAHVASPRSHATDGYDTCCRHEKMHCWEGRSSRAGLQKDQGTVQGLLSAWASFLLCLILREGCRMEISTDGDKQESSQRWGKPVAASPTLAILLQDSRGYVRCLPPHYALLRHSSPAQCVSRGLGRALKRTAAPQSQGLSAGVGGSQNTGSGPPWHSRGQVRT